VNEARTPLLNLNCISKFFGGVKALDRVSLSLFAGEILALVGDNGAGKSTLVKVLSGLLAPDEGEIRFGDVVLSQLTPREAHHHGIETVYQHLSLCENLGATANVMLGQEPVRWQFGPFRVIDEQQSAAQARRQISEVGSTLDDLEVPVRRLSGGQRQAVAIARALVNAHRLIMLDEPTAALGVRQTQATLALIRRIAEQRVAVILISHNLDHIFAVADRIVALRLGKVTLDVSTPTATRAAVVAAMTGMAHTTSN
jgi:ABC-type sugar transport system ATPase subunit